VGGVREAGDAGLPASSWPGSWRRSLRQVPEPRFHRLVGPGELNSPSRAVAWPMGRPRKPRQLPHQQDRGVDGPSVHHV
jgi:hypothetical protein